ncbi:hypothetical protein N7481_008921 [Penicillium waksmanii]|uniref:uncharacterized protein n=1 Tax=Penicillium waksmanii TaxID=69791 RepID=UPI002548CB38|nr:uncharacterized protein N7481_008921 [Penicillium waksmanii]KAJ5975214.1 hypothetical protein N7481_008921 [Penicillium waksmanii]
MSCHICDSAHSRLPHLCPTCARNRLYPLRLETTQALLEKEILANQIETAVSHGPLEDQHLGPGERSSRLSHQSTSTRTWSLQTTSSKQVASTSRRDDLSRNTAALKEEIRVKKADLAERRATLARRRADAESAQYQLVERETASLTGIQNATKRAEHLWHSLHSKTAEARIFLCREAAHLYGLRQKTARKGDPHQLYVLGGMPIVDLRDMNGKSSTMGTRIVRAQYTDIFQGATPAQISTSFSNVAQLLVLVSHYLSLRLPAEITLPHRDYPTPTIYPPASSYDLRGMSRRNTAHSSPSSQATSRTGDTRTQSRPRPLFIDKSLQRLAKEDPATYALFLEGATLLAWDVAWLCRTQGINLTSDSWEEVCDMGKSMYQLLVAPPAQPSSLMRAFASRDTQTKIKSTKDSPQTTIQRRKSFPMLGHYSHGTVHSFLAASEGSEYVRTWKLPTPTKIVDKLKANLLGEMTSAEWELLEENEWDDGPTEPNQPPFIQNPDISSSPPPPIQPNEGANNESASKGQGQGQGQGQGADEGRRSKGNSGWMKLNNR